MVGIYSARTLQPASARYRRPGLSGSSALEEIRLDSLRGTAVLSGPPLFPPDRRCVSNRRKFGEPEKEFDGKRICITGNITEYRDVPEIIANDPNQVTVEPSR